MYNLLLTTAAVAAAICLAGCRKNEPITYDTLTDERDGQTYTVLKIGGQTWMAQNLNYKTTSGSWCYENSLYYCKEYEYGRLYDWDAAINACPTGYHLPSREEWKSLVTMVGGKGLAGKRLKSKRGWGSGNGTDDYDFYALPGGGRRYSDSAFGAIGNLGLWWTATTKKYNNNSAYYRGISYDYDGVYEYNDNKRNAYSVRCVADRP